ncbi:hypothetical protein ACTXT7_015095 [Hymenolepis weldensis]
MSEKLEVTDSVPLGAHSVSGMVNSTSAHQRTKDVKYDHLLIVPHLSRISKPTVTLAQYRHSSSSVQIPLTTPFSYSPSSISSFPINSWPYVTLDLLTRERLLYPGKAAVTC